MCIAYLNTVLFSHICYSAGCSSCILGSYSLCLLGYTLSLTLTRTARKLLEFQARTLAYPIVLAMVHADNIPLILPYAKLGAEQTVLEPLYSIGILLGWQVP
jgi:hypothetical protein